MRVTKQIVFFQLLSAVFVFAVSAAAQTPSPTATPPEDDADVVKISTTLIQLDAVVTDKKGNQITDLKPEDFEVYENGKKQEITDFAYITGQTKPAGEDNRAKSNDKFSIPPPTAKLKLEQVKRTYAFVVDDLGLSFASVSYVKYALKKAINEQVRDGDLVAIIRTGSGIGALQSFTSDKRQLLLAIDKIRWNPNSSKGVDAFEPITSEKTRSERLRGGDEEKFSRDREMEQSIKDSSSEVFSTGTLGALRYIVRGMKDLPGRKSVILLSEGFQVFAQDKGKLLPTRIYNSLKILTDLANRSSVVFYTLDPRGLDDPFALTASDSTFDVAPEEIERQQRNRENEFISSQDSLVFLARETGGTAYINQNRLDIGLREVIADQSGYYLLAYQPDSDTFDPKKSKFNKLEVKVRRENVKVRYRNGFFNKTDKEIAADDQTPQNKIFQALTSPFGASDIPLSLNTLFANDEKTGNFIRSLVNIDIKNLNFVEDSAGVKKVNLDIVAMTFGDNGTPIDQLSKTYTLQLDKRDYEKVLKKNITYNLIVPIKKPGAYQFRIAVRDPATGKIGSASQFIEIPNLDKKRITLSGVVLDALPPEKTKTNASGQNQDAETDPYSDTSLRQFKTGTVLRYGYIIYNSATAPPNLEIEARLFRDNELILAGAPSLLTKNEGSRPETNRSRRSDHARQRLGSGKLYFTDHRQG